MFRDAYRRQSPDDTEGEVGGAWRETAELLAQQTGQHGDYPIDQVDAGGSI